jgi:hypothetical protein
MNIRKEEKIVVLGLARRIPMPNGNEEKRDG